MELSRFIALFLLLTFVGHGIAFIALGLRRRKGYYFFLTGTFAFLTAIYLIRFEGWELSVPGTDFPATWFLRIGATLCTLTYLKTIAGEEGTWLWKLLRRKQR